MGLRLYVSTGYGGELLIDGGSYSGVLFPACAGNERRNAVRDSCIYKERSECFMCDCSDHEWIKFNYLDLFKMDEKGRQDNSNLVVSFFSNESEIPDDFLSNLQKYISKEFLDTISRRDHVWVNIQ